MTPSPQSSTASEQAPASALVISSVDIFPNGMVVVCDQFGNQMPEFQGHWSVMGRKIVSSLPKSVEINVHTD